MNENKLREIAMKEFNSLEGSDYNQVEKVDIVSIRFMLNYDLSRSHAVDIACKVLSEIQAKDIPAYINIDESTSHCVVIREQGNPEPIYISIASIYGHIMAQRYK